MKNQKIVIVCAVIVVIAIIGVGAYFFICNGSGATKGIRSEKITAENYEEIMERLETEMKEDEELYYLSYSVMYYMMKDGMAAALANPNDTEAMYVNIYGKTIQQLINEGKDLMKENDVTLEQFKQQIESMNNQ